MLQKKPPSCPLQNLRNIGGTSQPILGSTKVRDLLWGFACWDFGRLENRDCKDRASGPGSARKTLDWALDADVLYVSRK